MKTMNSLNTFAATAIISMTAPALAQPHEGDILLKLENGRLVAGREDDPEPLFPRGLFAAEFGDPIPNATTEPGFDSEAGSLPGGATIGLTLRGPLRLWSGDGFAAIAPVRLRVTKNALSVITPESDPASCAGESLAIGAVGPTGVFHQHAAFELLAPADPGVYLFEFEVWMGQPGDAVSDPVRIVFNQDQPPAIVAEALEWAEARYDIPCGANCDDSTSAPVLNVADFTCFLQRFAAGDCRANCDRSTAAPVLNVADFTCFLRAFAAGCP